MRPTPTVQRIGPEWGSRNIPALSDYAWHSSDWSESEYLAETTTTGNIVGAWEGQPGAVSFDFWPYDEVCVIIQGRVAIEVSGGERFEFGPGDSFLIPAGIKAVWRTLEPTKKVFVGLT